MLVAAERPPAFSTGWGRPVVISLLVAYPALTLIVPGAVNAAIFLLFLLSIGWLVRDHWLGYRGAKNGFMNAAEQPPASLDQRAAVLYFLSMIGLPAAVFISQWANHRWGWPYYDAVSRFLISAPIFFALRRLDPDALLKVWAGFIIGALAAAGYAFFVPHIWGSATGLVRIGTSFVNPIHFGDIALTLGIIPLFGISWHEKKVSTTLWLYRFLALIAAISGLYASLLSGSRGGWIAIPAFLILAYLSNRKTIKFRAAATATIVFFFVLLVGYDKMPDIQQRINLIFNNLHAFDQGNENTSIGIRIQLWRVALMIFIDHPLFGVGMGGFKALMTPMQQAGYLTPLAADFGRQEVHSEILSRLSQLGLTGFIAIISVYVVPAWMFWRRLNAQLSASHAAARMGLAFVVGFFIYGLTVETFDLTMTAAFYALTTAVLLSATYSAIPIQKAK